MKSYLIRWAMLFSMIFIIIVMLSACERDPRMSPDEAVKRSMELVKASWVNKPGAQITGGYVQVLEQANMRTVCGYYMVNGVDKYFYAVAIDFKGGVEPLYLNFNSHYISSICNKGDVVAWTK